MGAADFRTIGFGKTAEDAFRQACDDAAWEHGHGGYTGTIAEKRSFREIKPPTPRTNAIKAANWIACATDSSMVKQVPAKHRIWAENFRNAYLDKWGDALAIEVTGKAARDLKERHGLKGRRGVRVFVFFGIASE